MKEILQHLFEHKTLSRQQAKEALTLISQNKFSEHEVTAFTTVFLMRSIRLEELQGFCDALMELCIKIDLSAYRLLDIVGTGGDGKNTFNISTLSAFIVAGTGQKVAKHGNYGASSVSGASNVMEQLGYRFLPDNKKLITELEEANICFLHAPIFHPALKTVAPVRKNLGLRTFFNMLGPVVNPAFPAYRLIGVSNLEIARLYTYLLQQTNTLFTIIHSMDGYDEISLTNDTKVINQQGEFIFSASQLGYTSVEATDLYGGNTIQEAASLFLKILTGKGSRAQNAVVLANAAMGLLSTQQYSSYEEAYNAALQSFENGNAYAALQKLISLQ